MEVQQRDIILGGVQLGLRYGITHGRFLSRSALYELLDKAHYLGFHTFDLAQAYGCAEERLAMWQQTRRVKSLSFGSKLLFPADKSQRRRLRRSRVRLGVMDYVLLHSAQPQQLPVLRSLCPGQRIGLSLYYPSELEELPAGQNFQVLQIPYSVADRRFEPYFAQLSGSVELQLRSLYLQGLLFVNDIGPYAQKYPALARLAPLLGCLAGLEQRHRVQRQDILLYAGLRHSREFPSLRLVLGLSSAAELLELHHSLLRLATWNSNLCAKVASELEQLPQLGPEVVVPSRWCGPNFSAP